MNVVSLTENTIRVIKITSTVMVTLLKMHLHEKNGGYSVLFPSSNYGIMSVYFRNVKTNTLIVYKRSSKIPQIVFGLMPTFLTHK